MDSLTLLLSVSFLLLFFSNSSPLNLFYLTLSLPPFLSVCSSLCNVQYSSCTVVSETRCHSCQPLSLTYITHHSTVYQTHCKNADHKVHHTFKHLLLHTNMTFKIPITVSQFQSHLYSPAAICRLFFCLCG